MPQYLERDPNALATLLRGQTQIPRYTDEEEQLGSMIPEEQLFQAQEALGERGAASGGAYAIPSREALKQGGMAELRKLFGIKQAEGRAKAYPNQVAGEYGLQEARLKGGFDVESARQKAIADAAQRQQAQEFQAAQQGRQQEFQGGQGELNRAAIERNTAASIGGRENVANIGAGSRAATQKSIDARKNPPGIWEAIFGGKDPATTPKAVATPSNVDVSALLAPENIQANVSGIRQQYPGIPLQTLIAQGKLEFDSPEEEAATIAAFGQ